MRKSNYWIIYKLWNNKSLSSKKTDNKTADQKFMIILIKTCIVDKPCCDCLYNFKINLPVTKYTLILLLSRSRGYLALLR